MMLISQKQFLVMTCNAYIILCSCAAYLLGPCCTCSKLQYI
jgi:hypothetical protein